MRLLVCLAAWLLPSVAAGQVAQYNATPTTLRSVSNQVLRDGRPAEVTCQPGNYPSFLRSGAAYVGFKAPVIFRCSGATFPGTGIQGAQNLTLDGGTFTGRLVLSNFKDVTLRNLHFPQGTGVMGRNGVSLTVEGLSIERSGAAISLIDVSSVLIKNNKVTDFSGNAGISAYGGGDIKIIGNTVTGSRGVEKGVHPDGIQTANNQHGTVEISYNTVILPGQGIFAGGIPDLFIAKGNIIKVDFPNALAWNSRSPAQIGDNKISRLPSKLKHKPRMVNYGLRKGLAAADDLGGNSIDGSKFRPK